MTTALEINGGAPASHAALVRWGGSLALVAGLHLAVAALVLRPREEAPATPAPPAAVMIDLPLETILPAAESVASVAAEQAEEVDPAETAEIVTETAEETPVEPETEAVETPVEEMVETPPEDAVPPEAVAETEPAAPPEEVAMAEPEEAEPTEAEPVEAAEIAEAEPVSEIAETALAEPVETVTAEPVVEVAIPRPRPDRPEVRRERAEPAPRRERPVARPQRRQPEARQARRETPAPARRQRASNASSNAPAASGAGRPNPNALARYLSQVRAEIMRHRRSMPSSARGRVSVRFTIGGSGALSGIAIARSSGDPALDRAALAIVQRASPVRGIPGEVGRRSLPLTVPFDFTGR